MDRRARLVLLVLFTLVISTLIAVPADAHRRQRRTPRPAAVQTAPTDANLDRLAMCESGMNPRAISRSGKYRGAFQFSLRTWRSMSQRAGDPATHTYEEQRDSARELVQRAGWRTQFPGCSRKLGFR